MNITPDTEPVGSAQRALELADIIELWADSFDTDGLEAEAAAILRHYAEILPKWQAVLDAEPVASYEKYDDMGGRCCLYDLGCPVSNDGEVFLIIKPAPEAL